MGKVINPVSFWNDYMTVEKVLEASSEKYLNVTSLKQFSKKDYMLYRIDSGLEYQVVFKNGDFFRFKP